MALNDYGDATLSPTSRFGVDVSSQRLDELDMRALEFVVSRYPDMPTGIDLGCGLGTPSIGFALAGARMLLVDVYDFGARFDHIADVIPLPQLRFIQRNLTKLRTGDIPKTLAFAYSQRTIHYLRFGEAVRLFRTVATHLAPGAPMFVSFSGLGSELGRGYSAADDPVAVRYARLSPDVARKHQIEPPICLYTKEDVAALADAVGLRIERVWTSHFGNIKAELSQPK